MMKKSDPRYHKHDSVPPELALIVVTVMVLKMVYGLDGHRRYVLLPHRSLPLLTISRKPADEDDPACRMPKLAEWLDVLQQLDKADASSEIFSSLQSMWAFSAVISAPTQINNQACW
jgi:RNA polymerase I-specific transcription initiation factor RRN7